MAAADFTIADVLAWARTKPADARYCYSDNGHCAVARFLRETGRSSAPQVMPEQWYDGASTEPRAFPLLLETALTDDRGYAHDQSFGALVKRLEALCPEAPVPPSEWTRLDAYLTDIELASA